MKQGYGNIEPTARHFFITLVLLPIYFQFTAHSLDLSDSVLHDWLFPCHCVYDFNRLLIDLKLVIIDFRISADSQP